MDPRPQSTAPAQPLSPRKGGWLIAAAATAAYVTSFFGAFQFDDIPAILDNPTIRSFSPLWAPFQPLPGALTTSGRPILNASFALNFAISGYHPWSYHALNLLLHVAAALTLFGLVRRTLERSAVTHASALALATALLWAVHPLQTESVTYVVQRAESLMGLCYLLTLYCFVRSVAAGAKQNAGWAALSIASCLVGTGVKEVIATAPLAVLLYDRAFVAESWGRIWRDRKGYYVLLLGTWLPLLAFVAHTGWDRGGTSGFHVGVSWLGYWLTQGEAVVRYLGLALFPYPLALDYGPLSSVAVLEWTLSGIVLAAFLWCAVAGLRGRKWAFPALTSFLILAPTSLMPGVLQSLSEHRMYLPLAAIMVLVVLGVNRLTPVGPRAKLTLLALAVILLTLTTSWRNLVYRDDLTLWRDDVMKRPASALAQANVGMALLNRGRIDEALPYCEAAVRLDPNKPAARYNLGMAYEQKEEWSRALTEFEATAALNHQQVYAFFKAGNLLNRLHRPAEALDYLKEAIALKPDYAEAYFGAGVALVSLGRPLEARVAYERSLSLKSDQPEAEFNLGALYERGGRIDLAILHYTAALRLQPDYGEAQLALGIALAESGKLSAAVPALESAVHLLPDSAEAHGNLGTALDQVERTPEAISEYRAALRLRPAYAEAHYNLGNALLHEHNAAGAFAEFQEALRLKPDFSAAREMVTRLAPYLQRAR